MTSEKKPDKKHSSAFVNLLVRALDDKTLRKELVEDVEAALQRNKLDAELDKDEVEELRSIFSAIAAGKVHHETYACPYRGFS